MIGGDELFAVELADVVHDVFVHGFVAEEDLEVAGLEAFEIRAGFEGGAGGAEEEVDFLLVGAHAGDVVGERRGLALFGERGLEAEELNDLVLVGVVEGGAFFQEDAEFVVKLVVGVGAVLGFFGEELDEAFGDNLVQLFDEGAVLHGLARDVERKVFAIDYALEEAEPFGEEVLGFGIDEDLAAVERDGGFEAGHAELLGVVLGNEEEGVDLERSVGREVETQAGLVVGVRLELVELGVLLVGDLGLGAKPDGLDRVDVFAVQVDREGDEGAVAFEDLLNAALGCELAAVVLQLDDDLRAALLV